VKVTTAPPPPPPIEYLPPETETPAPAPSTTSAPRTQPTTLAPFVCTPGSTDSRCPPPSPPTVPEATAAPTYEYPSPSPPLTIPVPDSVIVDAPTTAAPRQSTPAPFVCAAGSTDSRCPRPPVPTKAAPLPQKATTRPSVCSPGSTDVRCQPPPVANTPASGYDYPTPANVVCLPGVNDARCPPPPPPPSLSLAPSTTAPRRTATPPAPTVTPLPVEYLPPLNPEPNNDNVVILIPTTNAPSRPALEPIVGGSENQAEATGLNMDMPLWDFRESIPGEPEDDYPILDKIPQTSFTCQDRIEGEHVLFFHTHS